VAFALVASLCCDGFVHTRGFSVGSRSRPICSPIPLKASPRLTEALCKPSKTLAVVLEYVHTEDNGYQASDWTTLSMQMRQCKASALLTSHSVAAAEFAKEQETARGNFPGPCPIISTESGVDGITGVILTPEEVGSLTNSETEILCQVASVEDVDSAKAAGVTAFLVDTSADQLETIFDAIPSGSAIVADVDSMQEENAELEVAKRLKDLGATAILLRGSLVGDNEDVEYAQFAVGGLTKKKSSTFDMTGLTGSTNGHFGGVAAAVGRTWVRTKRAAELVAA